VDHVAGAKLMTTGDPRLARRAPAQGQALALQFRPGGIMNGPINATPAQETGICRVHDGIDDECCYVTAPQGDPVINRFESSWHG
jgi:hypothetical protein